MKKIMVVMVMILALTLSGCRENDNPDYMIDDWEHEDRLEFIDGLRDCYDSNWDKDYCYTIDDARYYTQEEVDALLYVIEHWAEMNDVQLEDMWEDIHDNWQQMEDTQEWCEDMSLDVPDDLGLLTSKECYDMIEWYGDNWEELYDLLNYMETLGQRIDELETQNEELERTMNNINERVLKLESELIDFERFEYEDLLDLLDYMESEDRFATELEEYIDERLSNIENQIVYSNCDIETLIRDSWVMLIYKLEGDSTYTYQLDENDNLMLFYRHNGNYKETITLEDYYIEYCELESD